MDQLSVDHLNSLLGKKVDAIHPGFGNKPEVVYAGTLTLNGLAASAEPGCAGFVLHDYTPGGKGSNLALFPGAVVRAGDMVYCITGSQFRTGPDDEEYEGLGPAQRRRFYEFAREVASGMEASAKHILMGVAGRSYEHPLPDDVAANDLMLVHLVEGFSSRSVEAEVVYVGNEPKRLKITRTVGL